MFKYFTCLFIAIIIIAIDQWSKIYAFSILSELDPPVIEVTSFFNLVMVRNYGVSFGMFNNINNGRIILSLVAILIVLFMMFWLYKSEKKFESLAISFVIGGAIGNIIDRVIIGSVADFLDFHISGFHWPAFNVADTAICIGVVMLLIDSFFEKKPEGKKNEKTI